MRVQDPHSFTDPSHPKIKHIELDLTVDFAGCTVAGTASYQLDGPADGSLYLDTRALRISRIQEAGKDLKWQTDLSHRVLGSRLAILGLNSDRFQVAFESSSEANALQWLEPAQTAGGRHPFLFSQCQTIHARSIFPCQDSPSVRFTYQAKVKVPAPLRAVMSAESLGNTCEDEINTYRFHMPQPIPAYLFALAVGNLDAQDLSPRCRIYAEPQTLEAAAWEFAETETSLQEAEKLFGRYDWDRYDLLIMPPSFPYGGMENPRLTFVTPTIVAGDRSMVDVITHELAHSWTGNLVTNATWEDFWLNEGWTTYAERRITEILNGPEFVQLKAAVDRNRMFEIMARVGIESERTRLNFSQKEWDPDLATTEIHYTKACDFLTLLEQAVGRKTFDKFIKHYIATHRFGSITTRRFLAFLNEHLPEAARAVDVSSWVFEPGFPEKAPVYESNLLAQVMAQIRAYSAGNRPALTDLQGWKPAQIQLFFQEIPRSIPVEDCRFFETAFGLQGSRNDGLVSAFLATAIRSGDTQVLPRVEDFVRRVGRIKLIEPLYRALVQTPWSRQEALPLFQRCKPHYHPITRTYAERILAQAGITS